LKPLLNLCLRDNGKNLYLAGGHVIEYAEISDAKPKLRSCQAAEPLDTTLANLRGFVAQTRLDGLADDRPIVGSQTVRSSTASEARMIL